jgi:hypothetical protein
MGNQISATSMMRGVFVRFYQKLRYSISNNLRNQIWLKQISKKVLSSIGITHHPLSLSVENLASQFYKNSQRSIQLIPKKKSKRVLFLTGRIVSNTFPATEGLLAWALSLREAEAVFLICDAYLTACELATVNDYSSVQVFAETEQATRCADCFQPSKSLLEAYGWNLLLFSQFVKADDWIIAREIAANIIIKDAFSLIHNNIPVGEQIEATAYRTLLSAALDENNPVAIRVVRRLVMNAVVLAQAIPRAFADIKPDCVVAHHGVYMTSGIACEYARQQGIAVVNWTIPYRRNTVLFSHGDTYHRTMLAEPLSDWENYELSTADHNRLADYLGGHWKNGWDTISYNNDTDDNPQRIIKELKLDTKRVIVGLYTNLAWDARIHYSGNTFANHNDWLLETIGNFIDKPQVQLVIRVHPAEVKSGLGPVQQRADELIYERYPKLPEHIHIIPPESPLSSYALMRLAIINVVFGTKLGLEMAALGLPVAVAGEAWFRGKGFTYDPQNVKEYYDWLENPSKLKALTEEQILRAQKYAYHFYFRRNISFPSIVYQANSYTVSSIDELRPGKYQNLDVICNGILAGTPFIAETPL